MVHAAPHNLRRLDRGPCIMPLETGRQAAPHWQSLVRPNGPRISCGDPLSLRTSLRFPLELKRHRLHARVRLSTTACAPTVPP